MLTLIYFIIILGVIVFVHEFGHFLFAKMCGIYVYEFSIGMGPKIVSWKGKNGETTYSIRAIPLGGFNQLAGEEVEDDKNIPDNRKLQSKTLWQRFLTMFFGAGFNFIFAIIVIFFIGLIYGTTSYKPILSNIINGYPAATSGIEKGDMVLSVNNHKTKSIDDVSLYLTLANKEKVITVEVEKTNGDVKVYDIKPEKSKVDGKETYLIGINLSAKKTHGFGALFSYTYHTTISTFKQMYVVLGNLFTGGLSVKNLSGPVGIYSIVGKSAKSGFASILYLVAYLSINVGVINLIPFPAFDGGRILFLIIEKIKGSPVKPEIENIIHAIGFGLLILLMLYVTFNDILKLF